MKKTTEDMLLEIASIVDDSILAVNEKGVQMSLTDDHLSMLPGEIRAIPTGGGEIPFWQPHPDWWDIKKIFEDDPNINKRQILLLVDSETTTTIINSEIGNSQATYVTSDGVTYSGDDNYVHTWDISQDKPCSLGYKTKYIMVYSQDSDIACNLNSYMSCKYAYIGNGDSGTNITSLKGSGTNDASLANNTLEAVRVENNVLSVSNIIGSHAFYNCRSLAHIDIPESATTIGNNAFVACHGLYSLNIKNNITSISGAFSSCYRLNSIDIPESVTSIGNIANLISLIHIGIQPGWVSPSFSIASTVANVNLSISSLTNFINNLGSAPTPRTITIGANNLAKLTPIQIAIATSKNYTLA